MSRSLPRATSPLRFFTLIVALQAVTSAYAQELTLIEVTPQFSRDNSVINTTGAVFAQGQNEPQATDFVDLFEFGNIVGADQTSVASGGASAVAQVGHTSFSAGGSGTAALI